MLREVGSSICPHFIPRTSDIEVAVWCALKVSWVPRKGITASVLLLTGACIVLGLDLFPPRYLCFRLRVFLCLCVPGLVLSISARPAESTPEHPSLATMGIHRTRTKD